MTSKRNLISLTLIGLIASWLGVWAQDDDPRNETAKLISDVDALLRSLEDDPDDLSSPTELPTDIIPPDRDIEVGEPFRAADALMPSALIENPSPPAATTSSGRPAGRLAIDPIDELSIEELKARYKQMSYEELLRYVDTIDADFNPAAAGSSSLPLGTVQLIETDPSRGLGSEPGEVGTGSTPIKVSSPTPVGTLIQPRQVPLMEADLPAESPKAKDEKEEEYIVMDGDRIDDVLAEKIREAIMETKVSHTGSDYPDPSRSVKKAEKYCNKVLAQLTKPEHKQYRRDILQALVRLFEKADMWVEAAKTTERFLEEFAADAKYPFANGEEQPTIADVHLRLGRIYNRIGAYRMAVNKFYDGLNATLSVPKGKAFQYKHIADTAMLEIADTYLEMEDYEKAIKFYSRLLKVNDLPEQEKGTVLFKHAYSHYQRAVSNLRTEARRQQDPNQKDVRVEYAPGTAPKIDLARVKHDLRDYAFRFPNSYYVPESYYLLVLTYDELNEKDDALAQVQALLRNSPYHPDHIAKAQDNPDRKVDYDEVARMIALWNFWKKKTGNYLANEFYEDGDYFRSLRVYQALANIDDEPSWKVPLSYQVGLCHERLGNVGEALRIYEEILETPARAAILPNVKLVMDMAKQRANFVGWATAADKLLLKASSRY